MGDEKRRYKSWELYTCLALNRLAEELDIDIYQPHIDDLLDKIFEKEVPSIAKVEISYEIKSNHQMTNKVLDKLIKDQMVLASKDNRTYHISITKKGVIYLRKFNSYFIALYEEMIRDHYRYRQLPKWFHEEW